MKILFSESGGTTPALTIAPLSTLMLFDQTELELVDRILQGFLDMYDEPDEFYHQLQRILATVRNNHPEVIQ